MLLRITRIDLPLHFVKCVCLLVTFHWEGEDLLAVDGGSVILYSARSYSEMFPFHEAMSNQTNNMAFKKLVVLRSWLVSQREWTRMRSGTYSQSSEGRTDF